MDFLEHHSKIAPGKEDEYVDLIKDYDLNKKTLKASPRKMEVKENALQKLSVCLKKEGQVKETLFGLETVTEVRHNHPTNLIQLIGYNNQMLTIRTKTRATKERWLNYLKSLTSGHINEENMYEEPDVQTQTRPRVGTADQHVVRPRTTNPRVAGDPQSEFFSDLRTMNVPPTSRPNIMRGLPEGEYDLESYSKPRLLNTMNEDPDKFMRDPHPQGVTGEVHHAYDTGTSPTYIVNIVGPLIQSRSEQFKRREGVESDERDFGVPNSTSSFCGPDSSDRGRPALPPRNKPHQRREPLDLTELSDAINKRERSDSRGQFPTPSQRPDYTGAAPITPNREASTQMEEESPYVNFPLPGIYVQRMREQPQARRKAPSSPPRKVSSPAVALKQTPMSGTIVHSISRHRLNEVGMQTLKSGGLCITDVPADLKKLFYHGDKILKINEQLMLNESFARNIIATSEMEAIKMTLERLPKGHVVQIDRVSAEESLGFQVDGTQITSVCPGSSFAAQLAGPAMADKMCVTHINDSYLPYMSRTDEVNWALQNAGRRFSIILQPLDLARELAGCY